MVKICAYIYIYIQQKCSSVILFSGCFMLMVTCKMVLKEQMCPPNKIKRACHLL